MKRPTSITVIGVVFFVGGCLAGIEIIYDLFHDHLNLNFAVLTIPVGLGLLKGRSSSRWWAKFWIALFSLVAGGLLIFYPFAGDSYSVEWFGDQLTGAARHTMAVGFPVVLLLLSLWVWRTLSSRRVAPFFDDYEQQAEQGGDGDAEEAV